MRRFGTVFGHYFGAKIWPLKTERIPFVSMNLVSSGLWKVRTKMAGEAGFSAMSKCHSN